jgi:fatty acid desaturase
MSVPAEDAAPVLPPSPDSAAESQRIFRELQAEVDKRQLFKPDTFFYVWRGALTLGIFVAGYGLLLSGASGLLWLLGALLASVGMVHAGYLGHDAGHEAASRSRGVNRALGLVAFTLLGGVAFGHWVKSHNRHHAASNDEDDDPDVQGGPFALYPRAAQTRSGVAGFLCRHQSILFWVVVPFQPWSLRVAGLRYIRENLGAAKLDIAFFVAHLVLWLGIPAALHGFGAAFGTYAFVTLLIGPQIMAAFMPNHIGEPMTRKGERLPFLLQQVLTSRNLGADAVTTFLVGGLNHQIEHHVFPKVSQSRLKHVRPLVEEACARYQIAYHAEPWTDAMRAVQRRVVEMQGIARETALRRAESPAARAA